MVVMAKSGELLIDPDGLYLQPSDQQPNFRVLSAQRLKMNGVRVVQCFKWTEQDVLQDRNSIHTINLTEEGPEGKKILVLETMPCPSFKNRDRIKDIVEQIRRKNVSAMVPSFDGAVQLKESRIKENSTSLALIAAERKKHGNSILFFNEAKCSDAERSRLYVRRLGFCNSR